MDLLKTILTLFNIDKKIELVEENVSMMEYPASITEYHQMFAAKYGFTENASILDLLFNMGEEGIYLLELKK